MHPLFSIITVTYNASATIDATLTSVASQSCRLFEYIVMDGKSGDDTVAKVEAAAIPEAIIVSEPDNGLYDAMNKAMLLARGDYLIFLNAGDSFTTPDTLQLIADVIMDNDYPGVVYGETHIVNGRREHLAPRHLSAPGRLTLDSFAEGMVVCHQAFIALRKLAGPYDLKYRFSADYDWCIRILQHSRRNVFVGQTIIDYLSEGVTTAHRRSSLKERFEIMCRYYGVWHTVLNHLRFIPRYLRRRKIEKKYNSQQP